MNDDEALIEAMARAAFAHDFARLPAELGDIKWERTRESTREWWRSLARAALAVAKRELIERCATVAKDRASAPIPHLSDGFQIGWKLAGEDIAARIRSLADEKEAGE